MTEKPHCLCAPERLLLLLLYWGCIREAQRGVSFSVCCGIRVVFLRLWTTAALRNVPLYSSCPIPDVLLQLRKCYLPSGVEFWFCVSSTHLLEACWLKSEYLWANPSSECKETPNPVLPGACWREDKAMQTVWLGTAAEATTHVTHKLLHAASWFYKTSSRLLVEVWPCSQGLCWKRLQPLLKSVLFRE